MRVRLVVMIVNSYVGCAIMLDRARAVARVYVRLGVVVVDCDVAEVCV